MPSAVVIPIDGFLRKVVGGQLNPRAYGLYKALRPEYTTILVTTETSRERTLAWLAQQGIMSYDNIVYGDFAQNATDSYAMNILRHIRLSGYTVSFWVTTDPKEALELIGVGETVLQYVEPAYALPEWMPGAGKKAEPWSRLTQKVETDRMARLLDKRMTEQVD